MGDFKLTTVEEFEAATNRLLETGKKVGADAWQYRVKLIRRLTVNSVRRVSAAVSVQWVPAVSRPKAPRGICGCDAHGIVGRNYPEIHCRRCCDSF